MLNFPDINIVSNNVRTYLQAMIDSSIYLFHITSEEGCKSILETGYIEPLTIDGYRTLYRLVKEGEEKGTASFTTEPIIIYENDDIDCFKDKNIVIVVKAEKVIAQNVRPVKYVDMNKFHRLHSNPIYSVYETWDEHEWRSPDRVKISDAIVSICKVPPRNYIAEINSITMPF